VFAGWLFKRSSSGSGNSHLVLTTVVWFYDGCLVLVTVVWFWRRPCGSGDGRLVLVTVVRFYYDGRLVLRRSSSSYDGCLVLRRSSSSGNGRPVLRRSSGSDDGRLVLWRPSGSGDGRLVLATVVWFWLQSSAGYRSGASLSREGVRKEGQRWHLGVQGVCKGMCRGCREYSGDPMVLMTI